MPMTREELLDAIIDDGVEECRHTYLRPDQREKLEGCLEGFEACRGRTDGELLELLAARTAQVHDMMAAGTTAGYWRARCAVLQIAWTLNVLSAAAYAHGRAPLIPPTSRGMAKAAEILGVERAVSEPLPDPTP